MADDPRWKTIDDLFKAGRLTQEQKVAREQKLMDELLASTPTSNNSSVSFLDLFSLGCLSVPSIPSSLDWAIPLQPYYSLDSSSSKDSSNFSKEELSTSPMHQPSNSSQSVSYATYSIWASGYTLRRRSCHS
eukprot:TRINITY_DN191_c0_g1_i2.p1 TRINITY_DN191_c0_g1~~TRINITY_DN191_c0_g1_i2.p1  ORF type:complete len:141 (-),score=13.84 TRINITY_DN191_c0_g1_i2:461-856(-)